MILLILLLTSSLQSFYSLDQIFFHTSFSCHLTSKPYYYYCIQFYEDDTGVAHDTPAIKWRHVQYLSKAGAKSKNMYNATLDGDSGSGYEFGVKIHHNCVLSGENIDVIIVFTHGFCQIGKGDCHVYLPLDLTGMLEGSNRQVRIEQKG